MARTRKKYANGQSRGGGLTTMKRTGKKNYTAIAVAFHGGQMAYDKWCDSGKAGYGK